MGHCDSSAQLGGHEGFSNDHRGTIEAAPSFARADSTTGSRSAGRIAAGARLAVRFLLLLMVRFYIMLLSPFMGGACKFHPSCSNYAFEAISRHGAKQGFVLSAKRLGRCRPFTKGGFDPVPDFEGTDNILSPADISERVQ